MAITQFITCYGQWPLIALAFPTLCEKVMYNSQQFVIAFYR